MKHDLFLAGTDVQRDMVGSAVESVLQPKALDGLLNTVSLVQTACDFQKQQHPLFHHSNLRQHCTQTSSSDIDILIQNERS